MRSTIGVVLASLAFATVAAAQAGPRSTSRAAREANADYQRGWEAMRAEHWDEAVTEFQHAIDAVPTFELAYYGLGRARMGEREFAKAIVAYTRCRDLFLRAGGERFANDMDAKRRIEDRMLQYQTALNQAQISANGRGTQTQQLYIRELQTKLTELRQARDRSIDVSLDTTVPFYISMALGAAYFRSNDFAAAEREYKAALDANSGSGETHNNLAVLYLMTGRPADAEREVALAEQTGFKVQQGLKADIAARKGGR
jgi:tetratricopeptide (TPR) repeat protein